MEQTMEQTMEKKMEEKLEVKIKKLEKLISEYDVIMIGAGAGLSTAAGFTYSGKRLHTYFQDFVDKYGFGDMYSGGFHHFESEEEHWAYWSRYIYINRYMDAPKPVYEQLYDLVKDKDYFVLTTNVDHCFQKAGFDKDRMFYTQGDYGLWQCSVPCHASTYDNEEQITKMVKEQENMQIPSELIPHCPVCGEPLSMNLRADSTFVEDEGWHQHAYLYEDFLERHKKDKILFLELGVGYNTPGIIKYPFWKMTYQKKDNAYVCINYGDAAAPSEITRQSLCIDGDISEVLQRVGECL